MAIERLDIHGNPYIGVLCSTSERYALVPNNIIQNDIDLIRKILDVEVMNLTIDGSTIIGSLCAMNSNGLLLPHYSTLDDLVEVSYISGGYIEDIKNQGLACVAEGDEDVEEGEVNGDGGVEVGLDDSLGEVVGEAVAEEPQIIHLNPQVIKSDENTENEDKNYTIYLFVGFCFLITILFIVKTNKEKNEFR